jgi:hypothetical protein
MTQPNAARGIFFVRGKRIIAQFTFGVNQTYERREQANAAAQTFVASRRDAAELKIIERRIP